MLCVLLGLMLVSIGAYAQGASSPISDSSGYWRDVAIGAIGIVVSLVGLYSKGIESRLTKLEEAHNRHELKVAKDYHDSTDVETAIRTALVPMNDKLASLNDGTKALHKRLDYYMAGKVSGVRAALQDDDGN